MINKAQRVLKFKPTAFSDGLREAYRWYLRHHEKDSSNYPFEDKLIALAPEIPIEDYTPPAVKQPGGGSHLICKPSSRAKTIA